MQESKVGPISLTLFATECCELLLASNAMWGVGNEIDHVFEAVLRRAAGYIAKSEIRYSCSPIATW
jgi:hypothetical protein